MGERDVAEAPLERPRAESRSGSPRPPRSGARPAMRGRRLPRPRVLAAVAVLAVVVVGAVLWLRAPGLQDDFEGTDGLVTNEFAYHNPTDPRAVLSPSWWVTSGSLFRQQGTGWTGRLDDRAPDPTSSTATHSSTFRMVSRRTFGDAELSLRLRVDAYPEGAEDVTWSGVHLFLRYRDEYSLYTVSVGRRDGVLSVKKKIAGGDSNNGTYYLLAERRGAQLAPGWHDVRARVVDERGGVSIALEVDGVARLTARDAGVGGPPLTGEGRVGVRGDNTEFNVDDVTVDGA
jgi:hypothetical protein